MTEFINKLATSIMKAEDYGSASNALFASYVSTLLGEEKKLERELVKKLLYTAQVFSLSENERYKNEGAILLSMLLDTSADDYPDIVPIASTIFSNEGDFPNTHLLRSRHENVVFERDFYSEAKVDFRRTLNTVEGLGFTLTDFQRSLWNDLSSDQDVITSAPTSAGKTYIILHYLLKKVAESEEGGFAAIIVPTRALISEVAAKVYEIATEQGYEDEIEICTVPREGKFKQKTFFVMTQERLHEVLLRGDISFDYLFIDEAHNIADKSRGVLLHLTIERLMDDSFPQIIISMPSSKYQNSFSSIFEGTEFKKEITKHSPVSKVVMSVVPKNRNLVISRLNSDNENIIEKGFRNKNLADIVFRLGEGQSNIIYRNRTDYCEKLADQISDRVDRVDENPLLEEAADYIEKFVHSKFSLANNLRKGVAFHYGPLPSSVRVMIENLVRGDHIKFIVCTSTLAEGVNLPAKNLFLKNPINQVMHQPSERVEDVVISNITGRAGRMLQHFSGNIFLIEPETWQFQDYFEDEDSEEEKVPTYFKSLNEELELVINALKGKHSHEERDQYRLYTIANKLIKEFAADKLKNTLKAKELTLSSEQVKLLQDTVIEAHDNLKVAAFTLEANPTVGYIQQNKLYGFLNALEDYEEWLLPHPKASNLYETLLRVCQQLHDFGVYIPTESYTLKYICMTAKKWIQGDSLKSIIADQIDWDLSMAVTSPTEDSVNTSVRNVIKVINNDIRFRLANALRCYQVLLDNILIAKGLESSNVKLHSFIEVGACEDRTINLINLGISREGALEINEKISNNVQIKGFRDLRALMDSGQLREVHAITMKEVSELLG